MEFKRVQTGLTMLILSGGMMIFAILRKLFGGPRKGRRECLISDVELAQMLRKDKYRGE